jgi:hypothetical protein
MKESQFVRIICNDLPKTIHQQSLTSASETYNGTPDRYLDANLPPEQMHMRTSDLWLEFKVLKSLPRDGYVRVMPLPGKKTAQGHLTVMQARWITRRWDNGLNAFVIVGLPGRQALVIKGGDIFQKHNVGGAIDFKEVTAWIRGFCGG